MIAAAGAEELALRATRSDWVEPSTEQGFELYQIGSSYFSPSTWMPRTRRSVEVLQRLNESDMPTVGLLFDVKQGALTGNNNTFIINESEYHILTVEQRRYFRPSVGTSEIRNCCLTFKEYVFYPYGDPAIEIHDAGDLPDRLGEFNRLKLQPYRELLLKNGDLRQNWWDLIRPREWQYRKRRKIVTAYFGSIGNFAFDAIGESVVVQGYGWLWRASIEQHSTELFLPGMGALSGPDQDYDLGDETLVTQECRTAGRDSHSAIGQT